MDEPTYSGLVVEYYENVLESTLNPDVIISKVKGKSINITLELLLNLLGLPNSGIVIREMKNDAKPHSKYYLEYGLLKGWIRKKLAYYIGELDKYVQSYYFKNFIISKL